MKTLYLDEHQIELILFALANLPKERYAYYARDNDICPRELDMLKLSIFCELDFEIDLPENLRVDQ